MLAATRAVVGVDGAVAAYTILAEWRDSARRPPKDRDFALGLGPVAVTPDEFEPDGRAVTVRVNSVERATDVFTGFDWQAAVALAADGTKLYPGRPDRRPDRRLGRGHHSGRPRRAGRRRNRRASSSRIRGWAPGGRARLGRTVTEVNSIHLVLIEFGDDEIYEAREPQLGVTSTVHEVIAGEFESVPSGPAGGHRSGAASRWTESRLRGLRSELPSLVVSTRLHELIERARFSNPRACASTSARTGSIGDPEGMPSAIPFTGDMRDLRAEERESARTWPASVLALWRRLLRPVCRGGGDACLRA